MKKEKYEAPGCEAVSLVGPEWLASPSVTKHSMEAPSGSDDEGDVERPVVW